MRRRDFIAATALTTLSLNAKEAPLELRTGSRTVTRLYYGDEWDKPFLFPIRTVSGKVLSRGFPIDPREGDSKDHLWHRGIWYGHGIVNNVDLWREQGREKTGRLVAKSKPAVRDASIAIDLAMTPPAGAVFGSIRQEFRARDQGPMRFLDADITINADAGVALTFGDSDDGGFAFRLDEAFREDRGALLRNSDGLTGTKNIWGKPARWVDYTASIEGTPAGVAIFDHPSNLRYPTRWHARGYGLCAANPFALKSFTKDPSADGSYTLPVGRRLALRYRVLIHEGPCEPADLERYYREYSAG